MWEYIFIVIYVPWVISRHIYYSQVEKCRIGRFLWSFIHNIVFLAQNSTPFCPIGPKNFCWILFPEWFLATFAFYRLKKMKLVWFYVLLWQFIPKKWAGTRCGPKNWRGTVKDGQNCFQYIFQTYIDRNWSMILKLYQCKLIN